MDFLPQNEIYAQIDHLLFRAKLRYRGHFGWEIPFGTVYGNTWRMDFLPQNEIYAQIDHLFFRAKLRYRGHFGWEIPFGTVYGNT